MKFLRRAVIILVFMTTSFIYFNTVTISNAVGTISDVVSGAGDFVSEGEKGVGENIDNSKLGDTSSYIYNLLLAIGIIAAVSIGVIIGVKFMLASVEEQAKIKELLVPYVAGCIVMFGAFGIWKLAVNIFKGF